MDYKLKARLEAKGYTVGSTQSFLGLNTQKKEKQMKHVWAAIGSVLAFIISFALNSSIWWAILAFLFSWLYILYAVCVYSHQIIPAIKALFL